MEAVRQIRPGLVVVENVAALASPGRGLGTVLGDLAAAGYDAVWCRLRASDAGAPHQRARLFFWLLPTPQARDHHGAQLPEQRRARGHQINLNDVALELAAIRERDGWGRNEPAIRRWEQILSRPAPFPGERGHGGQYRLSVDFTEWCQGLPIGWVAGIPDLTYAAKIRALGNGVVPRQGAAALRLLIGLAAIPAPPADCASLLAAA
jgi:DNA (cytosine-5)-methyltransferase 1